MNHLNQVLENKQFTFEETVTAHFFDRRNELVRAQLREPLSPEYAARAFMIDAYDQAIKKHDAAVCMQKYDRQFLA